MKKLSYKFLLSIILINLIVLINAANAVQFDARDTRIDLPVITTPNDAVTPHISSDENGHAYVVWSDNRIGPKKIYINTKFGDAGWSRNSVPVNTGFPKSLNTPEDGDATSPRVCSDNSGHVYVVWVDDRAVKAGTGLKDIYFRYSKDYGITWNAPDQFTDYRIDSDNPAMGDSINPKIACDENGNVYIAWEDDRNNPGIYEVYFRSLNVQFSRPTDFIIPYQTPEVRLNTGVAAGAYSAINPVITTNKKGVVYAAWKDNRSVPEEDTFNGIYFNVSMNNGSTWKAKSIQVDTAPVGFTQTGPPAMSNDDAGNVYIAWTDTAGRAVRGDPYSGDGTYDVYFNSSRDNGNTWGIEDKRINTISTEGIEQGVLDTGAKDVSIASNNRGVVCVVWADNTFTTQSGGKKPNFHIYSNHSENFGQTFLDFAENVQINARTTNVESTAVRPIVRVSNSGAVFVAWMDNLRNTNDIYFNYSIQRGKAGSWQTPFLWLDNSEPFGNSFNHVMTMDQSGNIYIAWQDDRASLTKDTSNIYFIGGFLDIALLLLQGQKLGEACFIATAAYGSPFEGHVILLREFRDRFLLTNSPGTWFVSAYYKLSPPAAKFIARHPYLRAVTRITLLPFIGFAILAMKTTFLQKMIIFASIALLVLLIPIMRRKIRFL